MASNEPSPSYEDSKLYEMAGLMANDTGFAIFRSFSKLNYFNILQLQHVLAQLEKDLVCAFEKRLEVDKIIIEIRQALKEYSQWTQNNPQDSR